MIPTRFDELKVKDPLTDEEIEEIGSLARHHLVSKQQRSYYLDIKQKIEKKELKKTMLIVQDFAQMKAESGFVQDLIFVVYYVDPDSQDFSTHTIHILPPRLNVSNDINFVIAAYRKLFTFKLFKDFDDFQIFSDGGPKHFKIAANIRFLHHLRKIEKKTMTYHFFESYHGAGAADGAAAHGIKKLNNFQRNNNVSIKDVEQYAEVLDDISNASAFILEDVEDIQSIVSPVAGIKKAYKVDLNHDKEILFYPSSQTNEVIFKKMAQKNYKLNVNK